jgi:hypothetical protein
LKLIKLLIKLKNLSSNAFHRLFAKFFISTEYFPFLFESISYGLEKKMLRLVNGTVMFYLSLCADSGGLQKISANFANNQILSSQNNLAGEGSPVVPPENIFKNILN